jgi:hypothetical protein
VPCAAAAVSRKRGAERAAGNGEEVQEMVSGKGRSKSGVNCCRKSVFVLFACLVLVTSVACGMHGYTENGCATPVLQQVAGVNAHGTHLSYVRRRRARCTLGVALRVRHFTWFVS